MKKLILILTIIITAYSCTYHPVTEPEPICIKYLPIRSDSIFKTPVEFAVDEVAIGWVTTCLHTCWDYVGILVRMEVYNCSENDVLLDGFYVELLEFSCLKTVYRNISDQIILPHTSQTTGGCIGLGCDEFTESDGDSVPVVVTVIGRQCLYRRPSERGCDEVFVTPFTIVDTLMAEVRVDLRLID